MPKILFIILTILLISCNTKSNKKPDKESTETNRKVDKDFDSLVKIFNDSKTTNRGQILYELNEFDNKRKIELLENSLSDNDEFVQIIAIQSIWSNNQTESADKLLELFIKNKNHTLNSNLCRTFADFDFKKAIPAIKKKMKSKNSMIIYDCIWTLGEIGTENEIQFLNELTENEVKPKIFDEDGFLRQTTELTIGEQALNSIEKIKKASR
ncbi:HEAT repeat domain-containing protein [Mariniflexile jejuense]|uniref:HEAT repeat domain-containing protein n=1 Tax=Mariniflexile jejuense TaxID=1173582 RepID=A0ABW3JKS4_9FLAO